MQTHPHGQAPQLTGDLAPSALLDAFWDYDRALLANDVAALDESFLPGEHTVRGDGTTLVLGHTAISDFRASRTLVPTRRVCSVHVQLVGDHSALLIAEVVSATGTTGMQTQLWRRIEQGWKVSAAHVTAPAAALDRSVWRVVGAPLVPGTGSGVLAADTIAVKDLFAVAGQVIGAGVPQFAAEATPETTTAPVVAALLAAGASITGLAQTDQFAYGIAGTNSLYGTPLNPAAPTRIPGGSSSGSASAVARGWSSIGLGTDTAGSIRIPAASQGLWGIRTSHGLLPVEGVLALAPSFDAVGWVTRDAETLARVAGVLVGETGTATADDGFVTIAGLTGLASAALGAAVESAAARLGAASLTLPAELEEWFTAFRTVQAFEAWQCHGNWITGHPNALGADVAGRFRDASAITGPEARAARAVVDSARRSIRELLAGRTLLLPTMATLPTPLRATAGTIAADRASTLRLTSLASIAGLPAVSAPLLAVDGLPAGLCFVGQDRTDLHLIATARRSAEQLTG